MSEEETFWVALAEKLVGLLLTIIGALLLYFTVTSTDVLGVFTAFFGFLSIVLLAVGVFLLLVKPTE
jgi:hypothetical protein